MHKENRIHPQYDIPTAITFLLAGIALGTILTFLFSPLRIDSDAVRLAAEQSESNPLLPDGTP